MGRFTHLAGSVSLFALSLGLALGSTAANASTGCDSIAGEANFTYTGPTGGSNSFSQQLQGGANFTFNPGDVVTLTITVPPLSRIDIAFAGGVGSVNNSGGGTPLTQTLSFTVPDTGGPSSGAFIISGAVVGTNTATVAFACANAALQAGGATNAAQAAGTADTALQSVVPGGLNGDLFGSLNLPDANGVFGLFEGRQDPVAQNDDAAFRARMEARRKQLDEETDRIRKAIEDQLSKDPEREQELGDQERALYAQKAELEEENRQESIKETEEALEQNARDQAENDKAIAAKKEEIDNVLKPIDDVLDGRDIADLSDEERAEVLALSRDLSDESSEDAPRLKQELADLEATGQALNDAQKALERKEDRLKSDGFANFNKDADKNDADPRIQEIVRQIDAINNEVAELSTGVKSDLFTDPLVVEGGRVQQELDAVTDFIAGRIDRAELESIQNDVSRQRQDALGLKQVPTRELPAAAQFFPSLPDLNQIHARFDLASARREAALEDSAGSAPDGFLGDPRFNLWFGGDITLHRDRRSIGQEGESLSADGGVSYQVADDLILGAALRYAHTDTEGDTGETISDTVTLSTFVQTQVFDEAIVEAVIAYSLVDLDLTFKNAGIVTGTGKTDASSLAAQARISQRFALEDHWWIAPNLGASIVTTDRDGFTTSDGTRVGDSRSTQVALVGGPTFGTSWTVKGGGINYSDLHVSPSFGLSANYNLGRFDRVVDANNNVFETDRFGLSASAGLGLGLGNQTSLSFNTTYAGIGADQNNLSLGIRFSMPLN